VKATRVNGIADKYNIPPEIMDFVEGGFLEVVTEDEDRKTVEFHIPSKRSVDAQGRITAYSVTWIHPDHNAEFCHYYVDEPGDQPNFYVERQNSEAASEPVDDLDEVDDLVACLESMREDG